MPQSTETAPAVVAPQNTRRPLITFRVVIRATGVALRRTSDIDRPAFGMPAMYHDALAEFASEDLAQMALDYVRLHTSIGRTLRAGDQLVVEPNVWPGITQAQENGVLCAVRDTAVWLAWTQMRHLLTNVRRGFLGIERAS